MLQNKAITPIKLIVYIVTALLISGFIAGSLPGLPGLVTGLLAGVLICLPVFASAAKIDALLQNLAEARQALPIPERAWDPFSSLAHLVNQLTGPRSGIADLRENLLNQAKESAAQQERNRLARELHDSIKQQLFSIQMSAAAAETRLVNENEQEQARSALADVRESAQEALVEMNALLQQLSPVPLEKVGLVQAIRDQCEALGYRSGAQVHCEIGHLPPDEAFPPGAQEAIFRILQEGLSNVARHARASQVWVELKVNEDARHLSLEIRDDGQGFDPDQADYGSGIASIGERAERLGGRVTLHSQPGQGTHLSVLLPYSPSTEADADLPVVTTSPAIGKTMLVGVLGGFGMALLMLNNLYMPFYHLFSTDNLRPLPVLEMVLIALLETALIVFTGWLAGRWVGQHSILAGAGSGAAAGLTAYGCIGGAWAATQGSKLILQPGPAYIPYEADAISLVMRGFGSIFWSTHLLLLVFFLAGAGLGALGGLLAARKESTPAGTLEFHRYAPLFLTPIVITGEAGALLAIFLMSLFEGTIREVYLNGNLPVQPGWVFEGTIVLAIAVPAVLCLLAMGARYKQLQNEIEAMTHPATAAWEAFFLAFCGLGGSLLVLLWVFLWNSLQMPVNWVAVPTMQTCALAFAGGLAILGVLSGVLLYRLQQRMEQARLQHPPITQFAALALIPLAPLIGFLALVTGIALLGYAALACLVSSGILLLSLLVQRVRRKPYPGHGALQETRELAARVNESWPVMIYSLVLPVLAMGSAGLAALRLVTIIAPVILNGRESAGEAFTTLQAYVSESFLFQWTGFLGLLVLAGIAVGCLVLAVNLRAYTLRAYTLRASLRKRI